MGKYDNITRGQTEALIDKLGGEAVVHAILTNSSTLVPSGVEDIKRIAFLQSYEKVHEIRNFLRGVDQYKSEDGYDFKAIVTQITSRIEDLMTRSKKINIDEETKDALIELIDIAIYRLLEFSTKNGYEFGSGRIKNWLNAIKKQLQQGNYVFSLQLSGALIGFLRGVEIISDLTLSKVDEIELGLAGESKNK